MQLAIVRQILWIKSVTHLVRANSDHVPIDLVKFFDSMYKGPGFDTVLVCSPPFGRGSQTRTWIFSQRMKHESIESNPDCVDDKCRREEQED
jgi:hypothetical protein